MTNTFFRLAYRGLLRNKKRTALTALAFIIGYVGLLILAGYTYRVNNVLLNQAIYLNMNGHIRIQKIGAENYWAAPLKYLISQDHILAIIKELQIFDDNIEFVGEKLKVASQIVYDDKTYPVFIDGYSLNAEKRARTHPKLQQSLSGFFSYVPTPLIQTKVNSVGASITPELSHIMGIVTRDPIAPPAFDAQLVGLDFESNLNAIDIIVNRRHLTSSAFMRNYSVEMDIESARRLTNVDGASEINIFLKSEVNLNQFLNNTNDLLEKKFPQQFKAELFSTDEVSPEYTGNMSFLMVMMVFFLIIIGGSVILSILNVLTMSIMERKSEIGTLLSLGYSKFQVRKIFIYESFILGTFGIFIGYIISLFFASVINNLEFTFTPPGALGVAFIRIDINILLGFYIAIIMLLPLLILSYFATCKQTQKKLVHLLNDNEGGT